MKHYYTVYACSNNMEEVEHEVGYFTNKAKAIKAMNKEVRTQKSQIDQWVPNIHELSIEVEDETGLTIAIKQVFKR